MRGADGVRRRCRCLGPACVEQNLVARGGAGVGLAIVRQLVQADGGLVSATSADGWTAFRIRYPLARTT